MIACDSEDPVAEYNTLHNELEAFNPDLLDKTILLALTKIDLLDAKEQEKLIKKLKKALPGKEILPISSVAQIGIETLSDRIWAALNRSEN
jgi:GTP-binding protein